jgi:AAA+ ATPase superfamily predicted ATPase
MATINNPFLIKGYYSKDLFCDRELEVKELFDNVYNGIDTTIVSPRRMGKTGLIYRFFDSVKPDKTLVTIYVDIYSARSLSDFIKLLSEAVLKTFSEKTSLGKRFLEMLKGFRPLISYDAMSGAPQIQINYQTEQEKEFTLQGLFNFLNSQDKTIVLAIDEFQQITDFPEKNTEAILRTHMQQLQNLRFIFCGSKRSMMVDIFSNVKRPFFSSTRYLNLEQIDSSVYSGFIKKLFKEYGKEINNEALRFIIDWTRTHTFYTQSLCNMVFSMSEDEISIGLVKQACLELLKRSETVFFQYRQLLTSAQFNYLIAIAKEEKVSKPTAQKFIAKYNIGTPANSRRLSRSLLEKELLLEVITKKETYYQVYDVFFSRWLELEF